ncbi:hypothetical protein INR49_003710 [Caranx melampygus]|nr:hypothetical protein INR49_003710 [Caranx melampygus]
MQFYSKRNISSSRGSVFALELSRAVSLSNSHTNRNLYLKLEDVTRRFVKPCIMDVKLGQRSYDPYASQEKREQQIRKYPDGGDWLPGPRHAVAEAVFCGCQVYKVSSDMFDSYDQHYGRGLVKDTIKDGLAKFFHNGVSLRKDAVSASIHRVQQILHWFESQQQLAFYASSLLFVYEGLPSSSSSSSLSSLLSTPSVSPTVVKSATLSSAADSCQRAEGKGRQEGAGREEEVAEYNNNNIQVVSPCDCSLTTIYTNHRKHGHHYCAKGHLHGNSGADAATETTASSVSGDNHSVLCQEDNSVWKRTGESQQPPNGNGNKSQLERKGEEGEGETAAGGGEKRRRDNEMIRQRRMEETRRWRSG